MGIGSYDKNSSKIEEAANKSGFEGADTTISDKIEEGLITESGCFLCGIDTGDSILKKYLWRTRMITF